MPLSQPDPSGVTDDADWTNGDVCLISSDDVRFRVQGEILAWASPVFADLLGLPCNQEKSLHLTDVDIEKADTLRLFLGLITMREGALKVFNEYFTEWRFQLESLIAFLDKYQCEKGVALLRAFVTDRILFHRGKGVPESLLLFAALLNSAGLCYMAFQTFSDYSWGKGEGLLHDRQSDTCWTLVHARYPMSCAMPFEYQWSLARAALEVNPKADPVGFGHKFVELILAIHSKEGESCVPCVAADDRSAASAISSHVPAHCCQTLLGQLREAQDFWMRCDTH